MPIGFIGLGAMGLPMAKNVVAAGHEVVTTYNRNREPARELEKLGAAIVDTPAAVAQAATTVITVLPADNELRKVVTGDNGLLQGFELNSVLIDMTTCTPKTLLDVQAKLRERQCHVLDAPVSGGTPAAADGSLTLMIGGDSQLLETYRPLLETMGSKLFHVGEVGAGKVVKMVNQLLAATHLLALGEAFALGQRLGTDPETLLKVIKESSGYSRMMDLRLPDFLFQSKFEPGFKLDLMKKDVLLALDSARDIEHPLFLGSLTAQLFTAASQAGHGEQDFAAAAAHLAELAGTNLQPKVTL